MSRQDAQTTARHPAKEVSTHKRVGIFICDAHAVRHTRCVSRVTFYAHNSGSTSLEYYDKNTVEMHYSALCIMSGSIIKIYLFCMILVTI